MDRIGGGRWRIWLTLAVLLIGVGPAGAEVGDVRIAEVRPGASGEQWTELLNAGPEPVSLDGAWLASGDWVGRLNGLDALPPGGMAVIHWNATGTTGGRDLYTGPTFAWSPARGSVSLHRSDRVGTAAEMIAYVQWGEADQPRADIAEAAGLWSARAFLPAVAEEHSLALAPGGLGHAPDDWTDAAQPTPGATNAGVAGAWRGWSMIAGRTWIEPALTYDVDRQVLDLVAVDTKGAPVHYRFKEGAWSAGVPLDAATSLPAAMAALPDGTVELVVVGADELVYHNRMIGGAWTGFVSTGQRTALPPALAYNFWARALELVVVGRDGQLMYNRFAGGQWGAWSPVGATASGPPALGVSSQESAFDLLFSALDQFLFRSHFAFGRWDAPDATMRQTQLRPAVAAGVGGNLDVVITATDGMVYHNRYLAGRWRAWVSLHKTSDLPPVLTLNTNTNTLELAVVGRDGRVYNARYINGRWTSWLALGAIAATAPALVQSDDDDLEIVVAGQDRNLWHNRFRPRSEDLVSFERDILPIFTNQCVGCHEGDNAPQGLILDGDHAYDDTVNAASRERRGMLRVTPMSADRSYLFHKVTGTQLDVGGKGARMPLGGQLSAPEIDKIRNWIAQGALSN